MATVMYIPEKKQSLGTILGLASTLLDDQEIPSEEESPDFTMNY